MKKMLMLFGLVAVLGVSLANATVEVRIINTAGGGDTGWIVCAGASCSFVGAVGNYSIASNIASQSNGTNPFLDLSYSARTSVAGAGTIMFEAIANGYTVNTPVTELVANGNSTLGDQITIGSFGGNNNTTCGGGVNGCSAGTNGAALGNIGPLTVAQSASFAQQAAGGGNTVNPYELGLSVTLANPTNAGAGSGDIQLNAVPEPASVVLLGGVLLLVGTRLRRKMRRA
jgi:hypothetical protein